MKVVNCVGGGLLLWLLSKVGSSKGLIVDSHTATIQRMAKELQGKMAII